MNLTLPKTKAYLEPDRGTLLEMCERYDIKPQALPKNHKDMPELERFRFFMGLITGHKPCPICNGPQAVSLTRARGISAIFYPQGLYCKDHPNHTAAYNMGLRTARHAVKNGTLVIPDGTEFEDFQPFVDLATQRILVALGKICEHNHYLGDCDECFKAFRESYETKQAVAVGEAVAQEMVPA